MPLEQEGHRQRYRDRFLRNGLSDFNEREALELLLFYAIPRKDTRELSIRLLKTFGSFNRVLEATVPQLMMVEGIGKSAATTIHLFMETIRYYIHAEAPKRFKMTCAADAEKYCASLFVGEQVEKCYLLSFDCNGTLTNCNLISEGTLDSTLVNTRKIAEIAINTRAVSCILTHNHPDGVPYPSQDDIVATKLVFKALHAVGSRLADHVLVTDNYGISLEKAGLIYNIRHELGIR